MDRPPGKIDWGETLWRLAIWALLIAGGLMAWRAVFLMVRAWL